MTEPKDTVVLAIREFVALLNYGVNSKHVWARIRRGSLEADQDDTGQWYIPLSELERLLAEVEPCHNCDGQATSYVIVKYHHHHRDQARHIPKVLPQTY